MGVMFPAAQPAHLDYANAENKYSEFTAVAGNNLRRSYTVQDYAFVSLVCQARISDGATGKTAAIKINGKTVSSTFGYSIFEHCFFQGFVSPGDVIELEVSSYDVSPFIIGQALFIPY